MSSHSSGTGTNQASGAGASGADPTLHAKMKMFAERQIANELMMTHFAAGVCGIIALVTMLHLTRRFYVRTLRGEGGAKPTPFWAEPLVSVSRIAHSGLLKRLTPFPSISHALLVATYLGINVACSVTDIKLTSYAAYANRAGWLASANLIVVIFLALKHTPLAPLSTVSYERLNPLHQLAGFLTILLTILHAILYTVYFMLDGRSSKLREPSDVSGIVAGFAMVLMGAVPLLLKKSRYEVFYVAHITTFVALIFTTAFHQPKTAKKVAIVTAVAGAMWAADRLMRCVRMGINAVNNEVELHPLPDGGTRLLLKKAPARTRAGKHCFLWIPIVRRFQTHPFSVVAVTPAGGAEFVIHSRNGFTKALHEYAMANPGTSIRAAADGAYGAFPDPGVEGFDKVVLIAGGSGGSFAFGVAGELLREMEKEQQAAEREGREARKTEVDFVWAVRGRENLSWFTEHLRLLKSHSHAPNVSVSLHVTRHPHSAFPESDESDSTTSVPAFQFSEKAPECRSIDLAVPTSSLSSQTEASAPIDEDKELGLPLDRMVTGSSEEEGRGRRGDGDSQHEGHPLRNGRPDVGAIIEAAIASLSAEKRLLVTACGPEELMRVVRATASRGIKRQGPGVSVHCETFGW